MTFADDDRGRVPFALVGVVLLVGSATAAAALATHDPAPSEPDADRAVDRALTATTAAVAAATRTAAADAVRDPVVATTDGGYGAALSPQRPFRDALALRTYVRVEQALRGRTQRAGAATVSVSLPRVDSPTEAEAAVDAVDVERVGNRTVRVAVSGVRVVVRRDGDVVSRSRRTVTATVHTPALALRDRVQRFERLLDRGALDGPGLDRRLTDYLHRVVWLRGPLQYGGAPIANVLANRHVELMANRALLGVQRTAFGASDDRGRRAYGRAVARVGLDDVLAVTERTAKRRAVDVLGRTGAPETPAKVALDSAIAATDRPEHSVRVAVNVTADGAFLAFVDGDAGPSLTETLRAAFTARASRHVEVLRLDRAATRTGSVPENWSVVDASDSRDVTVGDAEQSAGVVPGDERVASEYARRVVVTETETRTYADGDRERTVVESTRTTYRVSVGVGYELRPVAPADASRGVSRAFDAPAASVSRAMRDSVATAADAALVTDAGGVDALARRAAAGDSMQETTAVTPTVPESVSEHAYRSVAALRDRARNVSAKASTHDLAGGRVPTDALRDRVAALHEHRERFPSATDRAVAAVRRAFLARVDARLADREADRALADVGSALGERGLEGAGPLGVHGDPAAGDVVAAVDGSPAYLTLGEVTPADADVSEAYHPLAARNVNWFTVPHGDAASAVVDAAVPERSSGVRLDRAAQALAAANGTLARTDNATLAAARADLAAAVSTAVEDAAAQYRGVLAASGVSLSAAQRRAATRSALARWDSVAARGTAVANGSAAAAVATEAARIADAAPTARDRLRARLRAAAPDTVARESVRVDSGLVQRVADVTRSVGRTVAETALAEAGAVATERAAKRLGAAKLGGVPAGLPLAPVPGYWYATANAWSVSVEGSWARFAVRADGGTPVAAGGGVAYVREDAVVAFDVDGDGDEERVGRNERVSFSVNATVGVVVPSGPRGVGDVDGERDERSPGW